jgi:hypothetical protein
MNLSGLRTMLLAQSVMLFSVPAFAAELNVGLEGEPEVPAAVSDQLDAIKACFADGTDAIDLKYKVALDVSGAGMITAVRAVEGAPSTEQATCVEAVLKTASMPPLATPDATASVTIMMVVARAAEQPSTEPAPVEAAPAAEPAVETPTPPVEQAKVTEAKVNDPTTTAATTPAADAADAKPWSVSASLSSSMGQGVFSDAAYAGYSYAFTLAGSYTVDPKWLSLGLRLPFDQELTCAYNTATPNCRRFNVRDLGISASVPELYKDDVYTGIKVTGGVSLSFPFSEASRDSEQAFAGGLSVGLSRSFENVGPGTLSLSWSTGLRHAFSPTARTLASDETPSKVHNCRAVNKNDKLECLTSMANSRLSVSNGLTISYSFLEKFSASYSFQISNTLSSRLHDSEDPGLLTAGVVYDPNTGHSPNANVGRRAQSDVTVSTLEISYSVLDQLSVGLGLSTGQGPFIQDGNNPWSLRNPFWDVKEHEYNLSTFFLDVAATY